MYKRLALDLVKIFNEKAYLSIVLDNAIKELKLSISDKKVYTVVLYGVCEKKLLIDYNLSPLIKGKRVKPFIKNILRIGVYVIDYMNMKDHFIVNELVKIVNKTDDVNKLSNIVNFFDEVVEPILGISFVEEKNNTEESLDDKLINFIISLRKQARDEKRYDLSDQIRDNLSEFGITLKDSREGTTYEK